MIRLLGTLLIAGASLTLGLTYVAGEVRKLNDLSSMLLLLKEMRGELGARITPLPQLMELVSRRCGGAAGNFARGLHLRMGELGEKEFSVLWNESLKAFLPDLGKEEKDALHVLGRSLGRYELDRQLSELDICMGCLESRIAVYSSSLPEKKRMGLGMACSLGALLLIVLI